VLHHSLALISIALAKRFTVITFKRGKVLLQLKKSWQPIYFCLKYQSLVPIRPKYHFNCREVKDN